MNITETVKKKFTALRIFFICLLTVVLYLIWPVTLILTSIVFYCFGALCVIIPILHILTEKFNGENRRPQYCPPFIALCLALFIVSVGCGWYGIKTVGYLDRKYNWGLTKNSKNLDETPNKYGWIIPTK